MYYTTTYRSPVGLMTLASDGVGLAGLWLEGQKYFGATIPGSTAEKDGLHVFGAAKNWLDRYFAGEKPSCSELMLRPSGGEFRKTVWDILRAIPYGEVVTYGMIAREIAAKMGRASMSSQAVGGAVGHNPVSVIIPCHRVVGSNGSLTGYAGGIGVKKKLLELEGVDLSRIIKAGGG